jgi:hypothetical protein
VSAFWLVGGRHGSPASAVEAYMAAWQAGRPDIAVGLYGDGAHQPSELSAFWDQLRPKLTAAVSSGRATYGPTSGLDPERPFRNLRVTQTGTTSFTVELVRSESYQTLLLGFIPTAGQRTVVVEPVLSINVIEQPGAGGWIQTSTWRIASVLAQELL